MVCDAVGWGFHLPGDINFGFAQIYLSQTVCIPIVVHMCEIHNEICVPD
jgi:hypothetical protein